MKIEQVLAVLGPRVVTTREDVSGAEAIGMLARHNVGVLVVTDGDQVTGIVSERDIVRGLAADVDVRAALVRDLMSSPVHTCAPSDDLSAIEQTMTHLGIRHMPVLDHGELVGMVSIRDLVKAQLDEYHGALETLELRLLGAVPELSR